MSRIIAWIALLALGVMLAGCGGRDSIGHPLGQDELVLRLSTGGGLVPIDYDLTFVPEFSLYGDGRVVTPGPQVALYPGPALPNLQTSVISEQTVQTMLAAAREAGLFDPAFDYGLPGVADGPTTTIVINADGTTYRSEIYALAIPGAGGLRTDQEQARAAVRDLVGKLPLLTPFGSGEVTWEPYSYSALAIFSQAAGPASDPRSIVQPQSLEWPLGDLSTLGEEVPRGGFRRVVISGQDLDYLRPLLEQATESTLWESGGAEYRLLLRPLLPDEH